MLSEQELQELVNLKGKLISGNPVLNTDGSIKKDSAGNPVFEQITDCSADNIRFKEIIKQRLIGINEEGTIEDKERTASNSRKLIHVLNNKSLNEDEPDSYFGTNILPFYLIHPTQTEISNYVCFEATYDYTTSSKDKKNAQIIFYVLCDQKNIIDEETGIARHDLLAYLIQNEFNFSNCFGLRFALVSDEPSVVDSDYATRTLTFTSVLPNNILSSGHTINTRVRR